MRPTRVLIWSVVALSMVALYPPLRGTIMIVSALFVVLVIVDFCFTVGVNKKHFKVLRDMANSLAIRRMSTVRLKFRPHLRRMIRMTIRDRCPLELDPRESEVSHNVPQNSWLHIKYTIRPSMRGNFVLECVDIRVDSPLSFWQRIIALPCVTNVRVFPDFSQISKYLKILLANQTIQLGMRKQHRRGMGLDFHQLREYRMGDALNRLDWKATSKRRSLISREYQDERSQQLLFLIDTGKRMHSDDISASLFDQALDAVLLLSYIALQQGDRVAALCFGQMNRWIASINGLSAIPRMLNQTYDLQTGTYASDYVAAAEEALMRHRKRALIVLVTSFRSDDEELPIALKLLSTRHIVLLANLQESMIDIALDTNINSVDQALTVLGIAKYIEERSVVVSKCKNACTKVVEGKPKDLPIHMVNAYWELKRSGKF